MTTLKYEESSVNREFIIKLLPKVNYPALYSAVSQLCPYCTDHSLPELPEHLDILSDEAISNLDEDNLDEDTIDKLHTWLLDVYLVEGMLVCPDTPT